MDEDTEKLKREREMLQLQLEAYELLEKAEIQFLLELANKKKKRKSERERQTGCDWNLSRFWALCSSGWRQTGSYH
jgi:hypothetical protein